MDGHGGRDRAGGPDGLLRGGGDLDVARVGEPVGDERRLEGDDGVAVAQGVGDLRVRWRGGRGSAWTQGTSCGTARAPGHDGR